MNKIICERCGKPLDKTDKFESSLIERNKCICPKCFKVEKLMLEQKGTSLTIVNSHRLHCSTGSVNKMRSAYEDCLKYFGDKKGVVTYFNKYMGYSYDILDAIKTQAPQLVNFLCCHLELQGIVPDVYFCSGALHSVLTLLDVEHYVSFGYVVDTRTGNFRKDILRYLTSTNLCNNTAWVETPVGVWDYRVHKDNGSIKRLLSKKIAFYKSEENGVCII